ncbi:uncharacterized protein BT62DRAFT_475229 [Guyanagaster necrorhizus]|uniref:Uncharacterized protein n=1 Tax=Guyanagaster necrorhizus TaxID=856835 RepID=A0A9P8AMU5_9AGAR|nr:uncharacterized protein BT62DRAFT_475229 [Guyanagaster necrorhizus MCA 3950]KAG7441603.1 hypothetical protein BT62DRAFT_475229 [Guyanagaster necrorhizus MCA 3950]
MHVVANRDPNSFPRHFSLRIRPGVLVSVATPVLRLSATTVSVAARAIVPDVVATAVTVADPAVTVAVVGMDSVVVAVRVVAAFLVALAMAARARLNSISSDILLSRWRIRRRHPRSTQRLG